MKKYTLLVLLFLCGSITAKQRLIEFSQNIYSQFGEDGIIRKIFEIIGPESKVVVEFGAWDGFKFSNTAALWAKSKTWKGILIEGDTEKFQELEEATAGYNVITINAWVGIGKDDCLEAILEKNRITEPIDLLSIDVDGNDYHIFNSLKKIRPRVIVCEYNPTIPFYYDVYAPYSPENNFGQSVAALNRIAEKKGYHLVACTQTNAIFVHKKEFTKFQEFETNFWGLNVNSGHIIMVTTYDGKYAFIKNEYPQYFYGINEKFEGKLLGPCQRWDGELVESVYQVSNEH